MTAVTEAQLERRAAAIETSGWGARFALVQPHNACFWVLLGLVASGLWYVVTTVDGTHGAFNQAYTAAIISSGAFCAVFLYFLHRFDRWERTPVALTVTAFLGGGLGATFGMAVVGNGAIMSLYGKLFGQAWAADWDAGLTAPFVEETAKGAIFLLMMGLAPRVIRTVSDGLIVGAYVGLGFQILEDILYSQNAAILQFGAHQSDAVLGTFAIRAITGIPSHALYTALFSAGLVCLIGTPAQPRRVLPGVLLVLSAMLIHGVWDSAAALGGETAGPLIMLALTVFSIVAILIAIRWAGRRERDFMHDIMAPEVAEGTITEAELEALTGYRHERRAAVKTRADGVSRRREKHVLRAARDLAEDLARGDEAAIKHSRAEIARLRGG